MIIFSTHARRHSNALIRVTEFGRLPATVSSAKSAQKAGGQTRGQNMEKRMGRRERRDVLHVATRHTAGLGAIHQYTRVPHDTSNSEKVFEKD